MGTKVLLPGTRHVGVLTGEVWQPTTQGMFLKVRFRGEERWFNAAELRPLKGGA